MTDKELIYIKTIIEEKSITKAALKLYIAQPSLSQAVHKIESQLGIKLFIRTPNGLKPTSYGMQYYKAANEILRIYDKMLYNVEHLADHRTKLRFGTSTSLSHSLTGNIYPFFIKNYPDIDVNIYESNYPDIYRKIGDGSLDLAIIHIPLEDINENICYHLIHEDEFIIISNPDINPFSSAHHEEGCKFPVIDPEELPFHPYIQFGDSSVYTSFLDRHLKNKKINLNDNILPVAANKSSTANRIACSTEGFSLCPGYCVSSTIPDRYIYQFPPGFLPDYNIYAITPGACDPDSAEMIFIDFFKDMINEL